MRRPRLLTCALAVLWLLTIVGVVYHTPDAAGKEGLDGWPKLARTRTEVALPPPPAETALPTASPPPRERERALSNVEKLLERQLILQELSRANKTTLEKRLAALRRGKRASGATTTTSNSSSSSGAGGGTGNSSSTLPPSDASASATPYTGAYAILASTDIASVQSALVVCDMLVAHGTRHDVLIISPNALPPELADAAAKAGCKSVALGVAPYPPQFKPLRKSFRICWHKLRLWTFTQVTAAAASTSILNSYGWYLATF